MIVYDIETFPNCFTFAMEAMDSDQCVVWEISQFRDDRKELWEFFQHLSRTQTLMVGFNNIHFDYPVIHEFWKNPSITYSQLYQKAMSIIESQNRFSSVIWADQRFAPQIDLFKLHHFDNPAKSTSLKALQINMRSESVVDMPVANGSILTKEQINNLLIPYNKHDVAETKRFAQFSKDAILFREGLVEKFGIDVYNWNETKIGEQMIIKELGDNICYDRSSGKRAMRQTHRTSVVVRDIIFPYINFETPEFSGICEYFKDQVLRSDDLNIASEDSTPVIKTKGVFKDLKTSVNGLTFYFGTGGLHASIEHKKIISTDEWRIKDIDVASLYPSIAIKNKLAPEHLGAAFLDVYSKIPVERKKWQQAKGKTCVEANSYKLAANGAYGKSNSIYSPLYDPKFTLTITINGQLLLIMLAEKLMTVPTLSLIQCNTDGITYYVHKSKIEEAEKICKEWENLTALTLEGVDYSKMYIRDVNNYIAVTTEGKIKLKGAYWTPDPLSYHKALGDAQPAAWHKNLSNLVSIRAAVAHMLYDVDIEKFIRTTQNPYDFLCAVKIKRSDKLMCGNVEQQRNSRFFISTDGGSLYKLSPPNGASNAYKKANGVTDAEYNKVMKESGGAWDARVCTKNKSTYSVRENSIVAGQKVTICNNIKDFDFNKINYSWYIQEALKLVI